ncbi:hypothetical protein [Alteromonas macleodii]|uniref:hypothetical protein n=1 Tax=Alteromonas macleodii TaxID=28108 RepID=UPI000C76DA9F|nr:hypothetical protein [Alteromonas macleodii]AUI82263.1 hypothetical protein TE101_08180 [Alteromonas macleodii]
MGRPIGDGIALCEAALKNIEDGKFNIPKHRGKLITRAMVSKEAGLDAGFIKSSEKRPQHAHLNDWIDKLNGNDGDVQTDNSNSRSKRAKARDKKLIEDLRNKLNASLSREVLLLDTIRILEEEIANLTIR